MTQQKQITLVSNGYTNNTVSMIKPNSLIEIRDRHNLTEADHKVFNILIKHCWDEICENKLHKIKKSELRGLHKSNAHLNETIARLHTSFVQVEGYFKGELSTITLNLIVFSIENKKNDGNVYYKFSEEMRGLISQAKYFTRLEHEVLKSIKGKYALILYEMIAKREKMRSKKCKFSLNELKQFLGVEPDKYPLFGNFKQRVLDKAIEEVNSKSPFYVQYVPIKNGRSVSHVILTWRTQRERKQIEKEEDYGEFGIPKRIVDLRNSRLQDKLFIVPQHTINRLGKLGVDMDLYNLEEEFYVANQGKKIRNVSKAFQGFFDFRRQQVLF